MTNNFDSAITLPNDVLGFLEWSSGVIWINMGSSEYYHWLETRDDKKKYIDEAINHELFHALQVATSGYMNYHSSLIIKEIFSEDTEIIKLEIRQSNYFVDWFERILRDKTKPNKQVNKYLKSLDLVSDSGISARSIIEGSAYLWQKKSLNKKLTCKSYLKKLQYAPGDEYTKAFVYALNLLGENVYDLFFSISFISLCFLEPHKVFPVICEGLSKEHKINIQTVYDVAKHISKDYFFLGDVTTSFRHVDFGAMSWINPLHEETIKKIYKLSVVKNTTIYHLMSTPFDWFFDLSEYMHRPIIFNNGEVSLFGGSAILKSSSKKRNVSDFVTQLYVAVYCFLVYQQTGRGPKFFKLSTQS